jgi:Sulfotransferase domain
VFPSFFVVGPPRTGTSWLHEVLKDRTILPASIKETRFFDVHFHRGVRWYQTRFRGRENGDRMGEIAPTYFASREARTRIKKLFPDAKIVCIFRNPVERLISLYRVKRAYGFIPWDLEEALLRDSELAESSMYATHFAAWLSAFGSKQVMAMFYEDLCQQPQVLVDQLADFIEIPRFTLADRELQTVHSSERMTHPRSYLRTRRATLIAEWLKARRLGRLVAAVKGSPLGQLFLGGGRSFTEPSLETAQTICHLLRGEIEKLEAMLNRDLSEWKQPTGLVESSVTGATAGCYQPLD